MSNTAPGPSAQDLPASSVSTNAPTRKPEAEWAARIRPHLEAGVAGYIAGGLELIQAKRDLKKQRGSFIHMVEALGENIDAVEKWMAIARNPYLADSANLRSLPTAWTTLYILCPLEPKVLEELVETGKLHPALTGAGATALVRAVRGRNDRGRGEDLGDLGNQDSGHGGEHADADGDAVGGANGNAADQGSENVPPAQAAVPDKTIVPDSQGETARKLARLEELEHETSRQAIRIVGLESEIEELKAKLGPEPPIRHQRKLFREAVRDLKKADLPDVPEKERRFLKNSATTDLLELVRSAIRDGMNPDRLDLVYRPELH
jgi:hypothetical protein